MTDITTIGQVADQLQDFIDEVDPSQLDAPTPCTEWDVHALLNHVTAGGLLFAACIRDGACPDDLLVELMTEDQVGPDPSASFRASASAFRSAVEGADADKVVTTPWGQMPVSVVLDIAVADLTIHTVDLAVATGADLDKFDPTLLAKADVLAHKYFPTEDRNESFAAPVDAAAGLHPALQLAAYAGRVV